MIDLSSNELTAETDRPIVEKRGIDHVPADERRGSPLHLGAMWSGVILNVQVVVYGVLLVAFGLDPWQCVAAIAVGSLTWIITGLASLPGPVAGTTTFAINRAAFGRNGNRPIALFNWAMQIGYEVLTLVLMVLAASALLDLAGLHVGRLLQVALVLVLSIAQSLLPLIGHAAITRALHLLIAPFAAVFLILAWLTADRLHLTGGHPAGWAAFLGGVALAASGGGLGWTSNGSDYSRYLPARTSRPRIVAAVALGGGIPQALLMLLGVGVAFVTPGASDPVNGLSGKYPTWFVVIFLILLIAQMGAVNAINLYSSGVTLQAVGLRIARWQAVALDGVICTALSLVVVFFGDFNSYLSNFLLFMIIWFAPWSAIFIVDFFLRRGRYDSASLETDGTGRYRRPGGMHLPGVVAQVVGMIASLLWIHTSVFVGPLAKVGNGIDLSVPAGLVVAGVIYWVLARRSVPAEAEPVNLVSPLTMATPEVTAGAPHAPVLEAEPA